MHNYTDIFLSMHTRFATMYINHSLHNQQIQKQMRNTNIDPGVESRLLAIPIIFILLRMWGTIQFFFSLAVADSIQNGGIPNSIHIVFFVLGILQVCNLAIKFDCHISFIHDITINSLILRD